jgi:hypothetical protein
MIISCTCDPRLKLEIMSLMNLKIEPSGFLKMSFPYNPLFQIFKNLNFSNDLFFHQIHSINMYLYRG